MRLPASSPGPWRCDAFRRFAPRAGAGVQVPPLALADIPQPAVWLDLPFAARRRPAAAQVAPAPPSSIDPASPSRAVGRLPARSQPLAKPAEPTSAIAPVRPRPAG